MNNRLLQYIFLIGGSVMIALMVLAFSRLIAISFASGSLVNWEDIGSPPESIDAFQAVAFDGSESDASLFIKASDGSFYKGSLSQCTVNEDCWQRVEYLPEEMPLSKFSVSATCENGYRKKADPPGIVSVCVHYEDEAPGSHLIRTAHFALLNNGTIWVWQFIPGMNAAAIFLVGVVISIIFATLFFIIVLRQL